MKSLDDRENEQREMVLRTAESLRYRMERLILKLGTNPDYHVNSSGEVQSAGLEVDLACANLQMIRNIREDLAVEESRKGK